MNDAWLRCVLSAAIAVGEMGALGQGGTDPSSHLFMPGHIVHAPVLGDLNPMPLWAPVLKASNKSNVTFGGVGSGTVVDRCEVAYNADDIFGSNCRWCPPWATVLSTLLQWYNHGTTREPWHVFYHYTTVAPSLLLAPSLLPKV